jgi:hypothetical protein
LPRVRSQAAYSRREAGTVTCTVCGAEWFYPETIELSDVEFRCSMSNGARFNVISSRRSPLHKFVIQEIKRAGAAPGRSAKAETPASSQHQSLKTAGASSLRPAAPRGGWLARIVGRNSEFIPSIPTEAVRQKGDRTAVAETPIPLHDADEFNWSGFSCPYCSASSFVAGGCGHLACDGAAEMRNGRKFHQCFCGHAGFITGTIKSLGSRRLSVEAEVASPSQPETAHQRSNRKPTDAALPAPTQGGPPAKR